jgi:large subunit ribosomal protein L24
MKRKFSSKWKASRKPRKQRKYSANAPKHTKNKMLASHLSKEAKAKVGKRSATVKKGDKVKIMRGQFKGKSGKIDRVDAKKSKVYITGMEFVKKDGSKALYPIHASNLIIEEIGLEDKKRSKRIGGKSS